MLNGRTYSSVNAASQEGTSFFLVKEYAKSIACSIYWHTASTNSKRLCCLPYVDTFSSDSLHCLLAPSHFLENIYIFQDVARLKSRHIQLENMSTALLT